MDDWYRCCSEIIVRFGSGKIKFKFFFFCRLVVVVLGYVNIFGLNIKSYYVYFIEKVMFVK